ncbi:MAG: hypothetical protein JXX14_18120 [Deltaproteobacteria bacterium]|nr:hypothetical protein [Deltaproteobacteria bacterium]
MAQKTVFIWAVLALGWVVTGCGGSEASGGDSTESDSGTVDSVTGDSNSADTLPADSGIGDTSSSSVVDSDSASAPGSDSDVKTDTGEEAETDTAPRDTGGLDSETAVDSDTAPDSETAADSATQSDNGTGAEVDTGTEPVVSDCNDGIDNDGDGYVDWQYDLGCVDGNDDEVSGTRANERGFTTFDVGADSLVIYVSASQGKDSNDGLSPNTPVQTLAHGASLMRDGANDFLLLRRGDTWRGESLGRFFSGQDADHPLVISSYGDSTDRPRVEINTNFIDHNGKPRSYVSVVGLELVSYPKIPNDPEYDGETGGGFRYVGYGSDLLIEDCRLVYGELVVQSYGEGQFYENVTVRRNVIERSYHIDTCGQNNAFRPSGMYSSHVHGLVIEENVFDHNGWNEENVPSACATMYNHNMYLNADDLVVRGNIIARASSMGIKMRSDETGDADTLLFENNLFVDGEIGLGIGGNTEEPHRFTNVVIRDNVFSQVGLSMPTDREFAWLLDVSDVRDAEIENNYFLHQPWYGNAYGIQLGGGSTSGINVAGNLFYDLMSRSLRVQVQSGWGAITVDGNTFVDEAHGSCLIVHDGDFSETTYQNNSYFSSESADWFCGDVTGTLADWQAGSGETGAMTWNGAFTDPDRTAATYAESLGLESSLDGFLAAAVQQSRLNWNETLTADAVNTYIKDGFQ